MLDPIDFEVSDLTRSRASCTRSQPPCYYAAFVSGPDGHHIEAVRHRPPA